MDTPEAPDKRFYRRGGTQSLALEVFKLNTLVYHCANSYDSYADALREAGKSEDAILMYQKSLAMNPDNPAGVEHLKQLQAR